MTEADKAYIHRKQKDWEFDEPEPSDYAQFVKQIKGIIAWVIIMVGVSMIIAAVLK
jgi:hypothetical protein